VALGRDARDVAREAEEKGLRFPPGIIDTPPPEKTPKRGPGRKKARVREEAEEEYAEMLAAGYTQPVGGLDAMLSLARQTPPPPTSELEAGLRPLVSTDVMTLMSDVQPRQVRAVARGIYFARRYKSEDLQNLIQAILEIAVSKRRKGRAEYVQAAMMRPPEMGGGGEGMLSTIVDKFRGGE